MKKLWIHIGVLTIVVAFNSYVIASNQSNNTTGNDRFTIDSQFVDQTFEIQAHVPTACRTIKCPAVYFTDADASDYHGFGFGFFRKATESLKAYGGPDVITVGIGYPGDGAASNWGKLRLRDFLSFSAEDLSEMPEVADNLKWNTGHVIGGAANFLKFIRLELFPIIENKFHADSSDRSYVGYSFGSLFGLHILATYPDAFNRYVIGSAYFEFSRNELKNSAKKLTIDSRLFFGVGLDEQLQFVENKERTYPWMVDGFLEFAALLNRLNLERLEFESRIYPNEIHQTAWRPIYIEGLRWVFLGDCKPYLYVSGICPFK